jgi:hypothetical protein
MARRRGRSGWAALLSTVAAAALLASCAGTGYHYVSNSSDHTYFKVPDAWKLYDQHSLLKTAGSQLSAQERQQELATSWSTGFDANPKPAPSHVYRLGGGYPTGTALVQQLSADTADTISLQSLRNFVFDVDTAAQNHTADVIQYDQITRSGGFHGIHMVVRAAMSNGASITLNEIALLDPGTTKLYALVVSCSSTCYEHNQSKIEQVVDSWTVKDS